MRPLLSCAVAFALAALFGMAQGGCFTDDCSCPATPDRPQAQAPIANLSVTSYDAHGEPVHSAVDPESGTIEVTGDRVTISYQQDGVDHEVVYRITGPR